MIFIIAIIIKLIYINQNINQSEVLIILIIKIIEITKIIKILRMIIMLSL